MDKDFGNGGPPVCQNGVKKPYKTVTKCYDYAKNSHLLSTPETILQDR